MPSLWDETFGYACVEAMARGVPVIASAVGGLSEAKLGVPYSVPVREHRAVRVGRPGQARPGRPAPGPRPVAERARPGDRRRRPAPPPVPPARARPRSASSPRSTPRALETHLTSSAPQPPPRRPGGALPRPARRSHSHDRSGAGTHPDARVGGRPVADAAHPALREGPAAPVRTGPPERHHPHLPGPGARPGRGQRPAPAGGTTSSATTGGTATSWPATTSRTPCWPRSPAGRARSATGSAAASTSTTSASCRRASRASRCRWRSGSR